MNKIFGLLIILILLTASSSVFAVSESTALFLMIEPGARPAGMGNAFAGLADDATALFYNPSGLAFLKGSEVTLMHVNWLPQFGLDMFYEFGAFRRYVEGLGTFGVDITFLNLGEQVWTDGTGQQLGTFNSWEGAISASFATLLKDNWSVGLKLRYIHSALASGVNIEQAKGSGVGSVFAFGVSTLYKPAFLPALSMGANLDNMGPKLAYIDVRQADPIPTHLRVGLAYKLVNSKYNRLTLTADAMKLLVTRYKTDIPEKQSDPFYVALYKSWYNDGLSQELEKIEKGFGAEYVYDNLIAIRAGYYSDEVGKRKFATFGAGIQYHLYHFDFSYISADEGHPLSNTMRFSLSIGF